MTGISTDRLIVHGSTVAGIPSERLVHALAQLPDRVRVDISVEPAQSRRLERLVRAYGVAERATFVPAAVTRRSTAETRSIRVSASSTFAELVEGLYLDDDPPSSCSRHDDVLDGHRVGLITNIPAQYRIPLFARLGERLARAGANFRVFFLRESTSGRSWIAANKGIEFDYEVLPSLEVPIRRRRPSIPTSLGRRLSAFRPTIMVSAGFSPLVSGRVSVIARKHGASFGVWSGEHAAMATARSAVRRAQRRRLLAVADFGIAYGSAAGQYLSALNNELPVVYGRNTSEPNSREAPRPTATDRVEIIAVGDLASSRKGIDVLIDALAVVPSLPCRLTVIGGGRLLAALQRRAGVDSRIRFLGPLPPVAVREAYGAAEVFAFPSRSDVFGLALVEAMGSGLAVATSSAPGAVSDLCVDGRNAIVLRSHTPEEWAAALVRLVEDSVLRGSLGISAAMTISRRWTIDHAVDAMIAGLRLGAFSQEERSEA